MWGTTLPTVCSNLSLRISIHVPRVGDDPFGCSSVMLSSPFQSTSPVWGTTGSCAKDHSYTSDFNPRPPCGGRHHNVLFSPKNFHISIHVPRVGDDAIGNVPFGDYNIFQSTSPVWGTTAGVTTRPSGRAISIHVPRVGDDPPHFLARLYSS